MASVREVLQSVVNGLHEFSETLPDGNWQQVAAHLAAPGHQQILQQQQQILEQQQQMQERMQQQQQRMQQQQQQMQHVVEPIAQMQVMLQQVQVTQQQMQVTQQQMQVTLQQVQEDVLAMRGYQANVAIRFHNKRSRDAIRPLHKEREGGNSLVGALPPAEVSFPQTLSEAWNLSAARLQQLEDFYQVQFAGHRIGDRRRAFVAYISEPPEM